MRLSNHEMGSVGFAGDSEVNTEKRTEHIMIIMKKPHCLSLHTSWCQNASLYHPALQSLLNFRLAHGIYLTKHAQERLQICSWSWGCCLVPLPLPWERFPEVATAPLYLILQVNTLEVHPRPAYNSEKPIPVRPASWRTSQPRSPSIHWAQPALRSANEPHWDKKSCTSWLDLLPSFM